MSALGEAEPAEVGTERAREDRLDAVLRRCCWGLGFALAVLVVLALALWLGAHRWASRLAEVEVSDLRVEYPSVEPGPLRAHARLRLTNRTSFRLRLHGMRYRVEAGGREIARGLWNPVAPVEVPARGRAEVELQADLDTDRLAGAALAILGLGDANARLEAEVDAQWLLGRVRVPLAVERPLPGRSVPPDRAGER